MTACQTQIHFRYATYLSLATSGFSWNFILSNIKRTIKSKNGHSAILSVSSWSISEYLPNARCKSGTRKDYYEIRMEISEEYETHWISFNFAIATGIRLLLHRLEHFTASSSVEAMPFATRTSGRIIFWGKSDFWARFTLDRNIVSADSTVAIVLFGERWRCAMCKMVTTASTPVRFDLYEISNQLQLRNCYWFLWLRKTLGRTKNDTKQKDLMHDAFHQARSLWPISRLCSLNSWRTR